MKIDEGNLNLITKPDKNGKKFKYVEVTCSVCNETRLQRIDKYRNRKTDLCRHCYVKTLNPDNTKHGFSKDKLYHKYHNMIHRCYNVDNRSFKYYGGRGIGVCMEWLNSKDGLKNFYEWSLANGYNEETNLQIDRIDNDGDYSPDNCNYITKRENLEKMENLFGVEGRVVKPKTKPQYENLIDKLKLVEKKVGAIDSDDYVPLWDFLENLGKKKSKSIS